MAEQKDQFTTFKGEEKISTTYPAQKTLQYKTYLKRAFSEALLNAFNEHPDKDIAKTKVDINYPMDHAGFPCIVVKFFGKEIKNAGIAHEEWGPSPIDPKWPEGPFTRWIKYQDQLYHGDIAFEIYGLSSLDRDKISDALVEAVKMNVVSKEGISFYERIYNSLNKTPYGERHYITVNTDIFTEYGEQEPINSWFAEDQLLYQASYRVGLLGQIYSPTPKFPGNIDYGFIEEVDIYPWDPLDPQDTPPEDFPKGEVPEEDYIKIRKHQKVIAEDTDRLETDPDLETKEDLETT